MRKNNLIQVVGFFVFFVSFLFACDYGDSKEGKSEGLSEESTATSIPPEVNLVCPDADGKLSLAFAGAVDGAGVVDSWGICLKADIGEIYKTPLILKGLSIFAGEQSKLFSAGLFFPFNEEPLNLEENDFSADKVEEINGEKYAKIGSYFDNKDKPVVFIISIPGLVINVLEANRTPELQLDKPVDFSIGVEVEVAVEGAKTEESTGGEVKSSESEEEESTLPSETGGEETERTDTILVWGELDLFDCPKEYTKGIFRLVGECFTADDFSVKFQPEFSGEYSVELPVGIGQCNVSMNADAGGEKVITTEPEEGNPIKLWKDDIELNFVFNCDVEVESDSDGDKISDIEDNCSNLANTDQKDGDSDGVGDVCDNCEEIANLNQADKDGDKVGDLCDNCPDKANTDQADTDGDKVGDACEEVVADADGDKIVDEEDNCPNAANADQADTDLDGKGNLCDNCAIISNVDQKDADGDKIGNVCDNCATIANTDQADTDVDGIGNLCDNCSSAANTNQRDGDGDKVGDFCDNCPMVANLDQADNDKDGYGNVCDNCPDKYNPNQLSTDCSVNDSDSDGIVDTVDNCPKVANPSQADSDGDKIGNSCDNCISKANFDQADNDGDKIGNVCDNCPQNSNADQKNSDSDPYGDICDNCPQKDNTDQVDGDLDGVGTACDNCPANPNTNQTDTDKDGIGDACETVSDPKEGFDYWFEYLKDSSHSSIDPNLVQVSAWWGSNRTVPNPTNPLKLSMSIYPSLNEVCSGWGIVVNGKVGEQWLDQLYRSTPSELQKYLKLWVFGKETQPDFYKEGKGLYYCRTLGCPTTICKNYSDLQ